MIRLILLLLISVKAYDSEVTQIESFEQFVQFYGKQYKEDEYASRRVNFVENTNRMNRAAKLSGIPLYYSFYSDYSEFRFRKSLMTNNGYPDPDIDALEYLKEPTDGLKHSADWSVLSPLSVGIDPSIKCASIWAASVTSIMYMQYRMIDPLWNERFSVQQLLDCVNDRQANTPDSCDGASIESALRYVYEKGICLEKDYAPYSGSREKCHRITCNRYYIQSYKRVFPDMTSLLNALSNGPLLSTVGVNPDLLQFYISKPNGMRNFMSGQYHRYYVSGILDAFSLEEMYISLQLPSFHAFTRNVFYRLSPSCFVDKSSIDKCISDGDVLTKYTYSIEVEPIPANSHSLQYSLMENESFFSLYSNNNWIVPWSLALYEDIRIWGFNAEELSSVFMDVEDSLLDSVYATGVCAIQSISITGLFPLQCPFSSQTEDEMKGELKGESFCQLNMTSTLGVLSMLMNCPHLHSITLQDHSFDGRTVSSILQYITENKEYWQELEFIMIDAVIYQDPYSTEITNQIEYLYTQFHVFVSGITLLDFKDHYEENEYFYPLMKSNYEPSITYTSRIHLETFEQFAITTPFRFATKVTLQNACTDNPKSCAYVSGYLSKLFIEQPHYYLRYLDLSNNMISTKEVFRLLNALKNYPRLSTLILDNNCVEDSFYTSFRVFIQDSTIFPSLRRISLLHNQFSEEGCQRVKQIFLTQYDRSTILYCYTVTMGIKGLSKLITTYAPRAMKEVDPKKYTGRLVAVDASVMIYQYLVAIRTNSSFASAMLTNAEGEVTSHIQGVLVKTIKLMEDGIKPVFVFEGKPPEMKQGELEKRKASREKAEDELKQAKEAGNEEEIEKLSKRTVHMDSSHINDCKKLLQLMGVPVIDAASEAESQCAELVKKKVVWGMASEDMDSLTFGSPFLLRHLTKSQSGSKKDQSGVLEVNLAEVLEDMKLTQDEFIDMCILCGCDYCETIRGIGQVKAYQFIQKYKTIEKVIENLTDKYTVPDNWPYQRARELFKNPEVTKGEDIQIKFTEVDKEGLRKFLVTDKGFNPERVEGYIERLDKAKDKCKQKRMDSFFTVKKTSSSVKRSGSAATTDKKRCKK